MAQKRIEAAVTRQRYARFTALVVAFTFALLSIPSHIHDYREIAGAAVLGIGLVGLSLLWTAWPRLVQLGIPLGYIGLIALVRDGDGGANSGFAGLFLVPVLWLAISNTRKALLLGLVAAGIAQTLPLLVGDAASYPSSGWRSVLVLGVVATVTSLTLQRLISEAGARTRELEQASSLLAEQNEQLRELDALKDEFVALISHELQTPLTSINGYLEMVTDDEFESLTETQQQHLATVQRNVDRLTSLVHDLLFLARLDSGRLKLELAEASTEALLHEAAETAEPAANLKQIDLQVTVESLPPAICDRARLAQLIDNLVTNAIKFTPSGGRVELRGNRQNGAIAIAVIDNGIGIPNDEIPMLFTRFYRTSTATDNAIPGTGLGLAISQAIAQAHNTKIEVTSTPDEGTTFSFLLPPNVALRPQMPALG